jgi:hypothetical protein
MRLADEFVRQIPHHSVTLFDKGFWSADLPLSLTAAGENRHWLIPARQGSVSEEGKGAGLPGGPGIVAGLQHHSP